MVHLADGNVLPQEEPVTAAEIGNVTYEQERPCHLALVEQRYATHEDGDIAELELL